MKKTLILFYLALSFISPQESVCDTPYGVYVGQVRTHYGGIPSTLLIERKNNEDLYIHLEAKSDYCLSEFDGNGQIIDNVIYAKYQLTEYECSLKILLNKRKATTSEMNCMAMHGYLCSLEGEFEKK